MSNVKIIYASRMYRFTHIRKQLRLLENSVHISVNVPSHVLDILERTKAWENLASGG